MLNCDDDDVDDDLYDLYNQDSTLNNELFNDDVDEDDNDDVDDDDDDYGDNNDNNQVSTLDNEVSRSSRMIVYSPPSLRCFSNITTTIIIIIMIIINIMTIIIIIINMYPTSK